MRRLRQYATTPLRGADNLAAVGRPVDAGFLDSLHPATCRHLPQIQDRAAERKPQG